MLFSVSSCFVAFLILNLRIHVRAGPSLNAREDASSSSQSSSDTSSPSSPTSMRVNTVVGPRDVILGEALDGPFLTCGVSLSNISYNLGIFDFAAGCESTAETLHNLTAYKQIELDDFYNVNPEDYGFTKSDTDDFVLNITYPEVPSGDVLPDTNPVCFKFPDVTIELNIVLELSGVSEGHFE
ncbi:hypothetical protein B0H14DRAFT_2576268 [Mycena olivaceomarginata]|nr:hypothetical protein B0H14DRAFT_2576268 [Mycena olivaceomarginata]